MSNLLEMLGGQLGGSVMQDLAKQLGGDQEQTQSAVSAALPILMGAMARNASKPEGAESLFNALSNDHDGSILDNLGGFLGNATSGPGAGILSHVLGGRREGAERMVSQSSGLSPQAAGTLFETLAPIVMGFLGRQQRQQGLNANALAGLLGQTREAVGKQAPQEMGLINKLLDADGDGEITDDIAKVGMKFLGGLLGRKR